MDLPYLKKASILTLSLFSCVYADNNSSYSYENNIARGERGEYNRGGENFNRHGEEAYHRPGESNNPAYSQQARHYEQGYQAGANTNSGGTQIYMPAQQPAPYYPQNSQNPQNPY